MFSDDIHTELCSSLKGKAIFILMHIDLAAPPGTAELELPVDHELSVGVLAKTGQGGILV